MKFLYNVVVPMQFDNRLSENEKDEILSNLTAAADQSVAVVTGKKVNQVRTKAYIKQHWTDPTTTIELPQENVSAE